ncbi:MAG: MlaD family protein, partial [Myxococcota bacterium]|nr:MlaD family protein [Myxococcota bacterium]
MLKRFFTPFKVGLVFLAGIIAAVVMIGRLGSRWGDGEATYVLHAYFNDATGLAKSSQVRIAGIQVGEIEEIKLVESRARITVRIRSDIEMFEGVPETAGVYRDGATISKKLSGILGDYYLELTPGLQ